VVFTNGCFDILHIGHLTYLNEAKALGQILVIGLNSDASVKRLKGEARPINTQENRGYFLHNLKSVDHVEVFDEDTPLQLITEIAPDILVKGGDWTPDQIVGSEVVLANGGQVKSLSFKDGFSTTQMIQDLQGKS
jgi:D-glycero-beta-D-manno-heptose 1-phosphate adenylyltransferase